MTPPTPQPSRRALRALTLPFKRFAALESASSLLLIFSTLAALSWANSPWGGSYHHFKEFPLGIRLGGAPMVISFETFVNDALMAVFFLLVGLEIKREMLAGELASIKQSALPILGALGGMLVPAGIFFTWNRGLPGAHGWGIPMATDIAFALGVMLLLGKRVPIGLKVFLVALAIIDDIGAILVIAVFYTGQISFPGLFLALAMVTVLALLNRSGVRHPAPYLLGGLVLWIAVFHSGIHATIAGVALAFCIPHKARARLRKDFAPRVDRALNGLGEAREGVEPLLQRMESKLHPFVSFGILPLFALVNAGVELSPAVLHLLFEPLGLGILMGLCLGKPIGITLFAWLAVRFRVASLPSGTTWTQIAGAGMLGGIGFTMSVFIAGLGLPTPDLLDGAKLAILTASVLAGIAGYAVLRVSGRKKNYELRITNENGSIVRSPSGDLTWRNS